MNMQMSGIWICSAYVIFSLSPCRSGFWWFRIRGSFAAARWSAFTGCGVPLR
nr:hypothetical protein [Escherichia coli]